MSQRMTNTDLVIALGELAVEAQRARTRTALVDRVVTGLARLGYRVAAFQVAGDTATLVATGGPRELFAPLEGLLGRRLDGLSFPLSYLGEVEAAIAEDRPLQWDGATPLIERFFRVLGASPAELPRHCAPIGSRAMMAPLRVGGLPWGGLFVASSALTPADAAAFRLFATHVAASLEVVDSLDLLARRNRERSAIGELAHPGNGAGPGAEAERRIHFLSILWDLGRAGSEARAVEPLVARVLERLDEALGIDAAAIHALEDDRLVLAGPRFGSWDPVSEEELQVLPLDASVLPGLAVGERRTVTESLPDLRLPGSLAERLGVPHSVTVPLLARDRVVGTLSVVRRGERHFRDEELQLLEICASQVAVALENAQLFEQKRRRVRDLSLLNELSGVLSSQLELPGILDTGVQFLGRMFEGAEVFLLLRRPGDDYRVVASSVETDRLPDLHLQPVPGPALCGAVERREPTLVEGDADCPLIRELSARHGFHSYLVAPLVSRRSTIGAAVLGFRGAERRFTRAEIHRATPVASALAAAVSNAWLFGEERRRVEQLRLLLEMGRTITASLDLDRILETSAAALVRMIEAATAHIFLLDADHRVLRGAASSVRAHRAWIRCTEIGLDDASASARAVALRAPVAVPDTTVPGSAVQRRLTEALGEKSILALPLLVRDQPIGAVVIGDSRGPREWRSEEVKGASLVAHQVAVAVANARLYEDLRRSYADLARAQEELVKRERLAALGELSAVVAHEVRNPLGVIYNAMGPLRRLLKPAGDARLLLDIVGEEAERLNRIVTELLDFARPHEPALEETSLSGLLDELLDRVRADPAAARVQLVADVPRDLPPLLVDGEMIRRALLNVISNAVQAQPDGGTVRVSARQTEGWETVEVIDEGPGIPRELAEKVFLPFFTTKAKGTGLGLAVVKRIVEAHGGEVRLASSSGSGTTFVLRLPRREAN